MKKEILIWLGIIATGLAVRADFDPSGVAGLALWLDAADINGDGSSSAHGVPVPDWTDKSGGVRNVIQTNSAYRPYYQHEAVLRIDGRQMPAVRFSTDWLSGVTLSNAAGNLHVFVVSQRTAAQLGGDTYQRILSTSDGADGYDWQAPDWTVVSAYDGSGISQTYGPDIRSVTGANLTTVNLSLGQDAANGLSRFSGDIAEVLIYTNSLSGTEVADIESYLSGKWIIGTVPSGPYLSQIGEQQGVWSRSADITAVLKGSSADVTVCWDAADRGTNFLLWADTQTMTNQSVDSDFSISLTNLTLYSTYWYRLLATNTATGLANWSEPHSFTVRRGPVGAIRWDAWVGDLSSPGLQMERNLSPTHYHSRLPFYGEELSSTQVQVRATSQEIIDKEIAFAHAAGLDFWAYVTYSESDPLSLARQLHQSSMHRMDMNFCLIDAGSSAAAGGTASWSNQIARYATFFKEPNYQTVLNGRPLFFFLSPSEMVGTGKFASYAEAKTALDQLRAAVTNMGLPSPYLVGMGFSATAIATNSAKLGLDAISNYAPNGSDVEAPYSMLTDIVTNWWTAAGNTGAKVIPPAMSGWDRRPRIENPVSWEPWQEPGVGISNYYARPTPQQLAEHVQAARDWCATNPSAAEADALIIYAWNEIDEGGWIVPTRTEQTDHLKALQGVLYTDPDADQDGIPDLWEAWYFNSPTGANASSDADGDLFPDRSEYVAGTDPQDAESVFAMNGIPVISGTNAVLSWSSVTGRIYAVQFSSNLVSGIWTTLAETVTSVAPTTVITSEVPSSAGFYRVRVQDNE